jgi:hypothetical protein
MASLQQGFGAPWQLPGQRNALQPQRGAENVLQSTEGGGEEQPETWLKWDLDLDGSVLDMEKSGEILVNDESMMVERIGELSLMIELIGEKKTGNKCFCEVAKLCRSFHRYGWLIMFFSM